MRRLMHSPREMKSSCFQHHPRVPGAALVYAWIGLFFSVGAQAQQAPSQTAAHHTVVMLLPGLADQGPCAAELEAVQNQLADLAVLRPQPEWPTLGTALSPLSGFHHYALSFAPPWETQVGDEVVAIGFARSLAGPPTLTKGIVSALDRELVDQYSFTDLIQTDAAINPGNSGGPLIDMRGRVVGINTYSLNHVGTPGIGFARSTRTLIPMVQMLQQGPLRRPDLGIETHNLSPADNDVLGLAPGLLILDVKQGLPAQRAGVQPGDLLVRVGAQRVARPGDLHNALALVGEEKSLSLVVWRLPTSAIRNLAEGEAGIQRLEMTRALHPYGAIDLKSIRKLNLWAELE